MEEIRQEWMATFTTFISIVLKGSIYIYFFGSIFLKGSIYMYVCICFRSRILKGSRYMILALEFYCKFLFQLQIVHVKPCLLFRMSLEMFVLYLRNESPNLFKLNIECVKSTNPS